MKDSPGIGFYSPFLTPEQKASLRLVQEGLAEGHAEQRDAGMRAFLVAAFALTRVAILQRWPDLDPGVLEEIRDDESDDWDHLRPVLWNGDNLSPFASRLLAWHQGELQDGDIAMAMAELNNYLAASVDFYETLREDDGEAPTPSEEILLSDAAPLTLTPKMLALPGDDEDEEEESGEDQAGMGPPLVLQLQWGDDLEVPRALSVSAESWLSRVANQPEDDEEEDLPEPAVRTQGEAETAGGLEQVRELSSELVDAPKEGEARGDDSPAHEEIGGEAELLASGLPEEPLELLEGPALGFMELAGEAPAEELVEIVFEEPAVGESSRARPAEPMVLQLIQADEWRVPPEPEDDEGMGDALFPEDDLGLERESPEPEGTLLRQEAPLETAQAGASEEVVLAEEVGDAEREVAGPGAEVGDAEPKDSLGPGEGDLDAEAAPSAGPALVAEAVVATVPIAGDLRSTEDLPAEPSAPPVPRASMIVLREAEPEGEDGQEMLEISAVPLSPLEQRNQLIVKKKYLGYGKNHDGVMGYCGQLTLSRFDDQALSARLESSNPLLFLTPTTLAGKKPVVTYWMPPAAFPQPSGHLSIKTSEHSKVLAVGSLFPQSRTDFLKNRQVVLLLLAPSLLGLLYFTFVYLLSASNIVEQVKAIFPDAYAAATAGSVAADFRSQGVGLYQLEVVPASESLQLIWAALIWLCPLIATKFFRHLSRSRQRSYGAVLAASLVLPTMGLFAIWKAQKAIFPIFSHPDFAPLDLRGFFPWSLPLNLMVAGYLFLSVHGVWDRKVASGELRLALPVALSAVYLLVCFLLIFGRSWLG